MARVLGLDLGTNSIGWALVDDKKKEIIGTGVRVFQEGVNRDTKGAEVSKNEDRRNARQLRRQTHRTILRKNRLSGELKKYGMYPSNGELTQYFSPNPYELRKKGLDEKLTLLEFGRVLYHLSERRGFKSNRKSDTSEDGAIFEGKPKENKIGITETQTKINEGDFRTLGEYLGSLNPQEQRIRNRYTLRSMYEDEFNKLWYSQSKYYPSILTNELKNILGNTKTGIIFFQRPLKSQKHLVGKCLFEPKKHRCPISALDYQRFRMYQYLNNIEVYGPDRISKLVDTERKKIEELFYAKDTLEIKDIRKKLKLSDDFSFNYNEKDKFPGNDTAVKLSKLFDEKVWNNFSHKEKEDIWHVFFTADDNAWLQRYAQEKWSFNAEQISKLSKTHLKQGYASLSKKAILKILPFLEQGQIYSDAAKSAGYHHSDVEKYTPNEDGTLPLPKNLRNPIVQQALFELRKVINALIQEYGKPDVICVELAREMKMPKWKRDEIRFGNKEREKKNIDIVNILRLEIGIDRPSREDIQKYLLWKDCGKMCPYTGKEISITQLYNGEFEIEHIIPWSRSLDDSMANKTLCYKEENIAKGDKTPFEYYSGNNVRYNEILERVKKFMPRKYRKFSQEAIDDDFVKKQLNDTAYISKEAKAYLQTICEKVHITKGTVTSDLRHFWALDRILNPKEIDIKNRDDHRHHAVDVLVVACTTPGMLHELSTWSKYNRKPESDHFLTPWESFREDAKKSINNILVSHRVKNRVRGQLHEDTFYGSLKNPENTKELLTDKNGVPYFATRKSLTALTAAMIEKVIDPVIKETLKKRLREKGANIDAKKFEIPKDAFTEPLYMPSGKVQIKKVRIMTPSNTMRQLYQDINKWVDPGSNHHIVIFEKPDGKREGRAVSLYEAVRRKRKKIPVIDKNVGEGNKFVMSLSINELVLAGINEEAIDWDNMKDNNEISSKLYRVQKMTFDGEITFRHHLTSVFKNEDGIEVGRLIRTVNSFKGVKVSISPTGKISKIN